MWVSYLDALAQIEDSEVQLELASLDFAEGIILSNTADR